MSAGAALGGAMLGALALAGCQSLDWMNGPPPAEPAAVSDPAEMRIAEAMVQAKEAIVTLAEERAAGAAPVVDIPRLVAPELQTRVTLDWLGPLERLAERLAEEIGYDFVVAGQQPPAPVMVEIEVKDEPAIFVLRNVGVQARDRAVLTVDAGRMQVRLDWTRPKAKPEGAAPPAEDGS